MQFKKFISYLLCATLSAACLPASYANSAAATLNCQTCQQLHDEGNQNCLNAYPQVQTSTPPLQETQKYKDCLAKNYNPTCASMNCN